MKYKFLKLLKEGYYNLTEYDERVFKEIIRDDGLSKFKPKFNLYGFLFGWFYLLYRRMSIEAIAVLLISLSFGYILAALKFHPLIVVFIIIFINSLLGGFFYYFLYLNKFNRDLEYCGEYNTDIECLKKRAIPKIWPVVVAILLILFFIWPFIYLVVSGNKLA